jgi:hypothetical protein
VTPRTPIELRVEVPAVPKPGLLRAAIERRLAGTAFPAGPEDVVAKAVARAVREAPDPEAGAWR